MFGFFNRIPTFLAEDCAWRLVCPNRKPEIEGFVCEHDSSPHSKFTDRLLLWLLVDYSVSFSIV